MTITIPSPRHGPRLLVVDDDAAVRGFVARVLSRVADRVVEAASGEEALERLRSDPPDLVVLDLDLPGRSGQEILERIRDEERTRLLPVVMVTGAGSRDDRLLAIRTGVTDFLSKPFDPEELRERVRSLLEFKFATDGLEDAEKVAIALARVVDARDPYTAGHSERVAFYAGLLGERIRLAPGELAALAAGCLFHDLGKIAVRDDVLFKPGALTRAEYGEIQRHPVEGRRVLESMKTLERSLPVVHHHHERCDGSGYPDGLAGEAIPLSARIAAIADVFDALTTARRYKDAYPKSLALEILDEETRRGWWDPRLVAEFHAVAERLPER